MPQMNKDGPFPLLLNRLSVSPHDSSIMEALCSKINKQVVDFRSESGSRTRYYLKTLTRTGFQDKKPTQKLQNEKIIIII
ncbi:hypothetical protein B296_00034585 [Ensete ventricosum]|uniref:Uncharacterized protein n=1 Tax=Ensete ventricosum TaxID=4639 RepID=A0A427A7Z8_ENSVE|nr:hypothetical protein B296_00034585 [Ensete ventricosum]